MPSLSDLLDKLNEFLKEIAPPQPAPTPPTPPVDVTPDPTPPDPTPPVVIDPSLPTEVISSSGLIYGLMITDALCDTDLEKRKADLIKLRKSYNTILVLADLQKSGIKPSRPYAAWARDKNNLNALGVKNLKFLKSLGFNVHIITFNAWGAINGWSAQMASTQAAGLTEDKVYTAAFLEQEKKFVSNMIRDYGSMIDGIMPALESQSPNGAKFSYEIAKHLRSIGFKGIISYNVLGAGGQTLKNYDFKSLGALKASSQNDIGKWTSSDNAIRNSDGMQTLSAAAPADIKKIYTNPGPAGFYMWSKEFVGGAGGRSMNISSAYLIDPNTKPNTPVVTPEAPATLDPAKLTSGFLWKPQSDNDKKLVILFPTGFVGRHKEAYVIGADGFKENGKFTSESSNGNRVHYRFLKAGGSYKAPALAVIKLKDGSVFSYKVSNPAARTENVRPTLTTAGNPIPAPDPTPNPTPTPPPSGKLNLNGVQVVGDTFVLPAGFPASRVIMTKGYDKDSFAGIVFGRNVVGPATLNMPANWKTLPRTAAGELLIYLDGPALTAPFRQIEFWLNPQTRVIRFGEAWHKTKASGGSFYKQNGYDIKMGSSGDASYSRAYAVFAHTPQDTTPVPAPTPSPTPDPTPTPEPTPEPPPPPANGKLVYPMLAGFFMEAQGAGPNFGCKTPVVMAMTGAVSGGYTIDLLHPWYGEWKAEKNEAYVRDWARASLSRADCHGIGLDHEGWTLKSPDILRWLYEEAERYKKVFINVPKIALDHQMKAWKMSYAQVAQIMNRYTHGIGGWIYNYKGVHYESAVRQLRVNGYAKQIWCIGDDGTRPHYGGITVADAQATVKYLAARGINFMCFNPKTQSKPVTDTMAAVYKGAASVSSFVSLSVEDVEMPDVDAPCNRSLTDNDFVLV